MRTITFEGSPYQLGFKLGLEAKTIFANYIKTCHHFTDLLPWRDSEWLDDIEQQIQQYFPRIYQELQGLADGCEQDFKDILLWNCRGDLLNTPPEGCTSIAVKTQDHTIIAHNEDGDPELRGHCFLLNATLDNSVRIFCFIYPGSIPGHTICANSHGLVYTVNNIRLNEQGTGLPRMIISRALLESKNSEAFIDLLQKHKRSGGFHYTLADKHNLLPISIEAPFQGISVNKIEQVSVHANHLIHPQQTHINQTITHSSQCRQNRMEALVKRVASSINEDKCFAILQDIESHKLPIFRTEPDDPDEENTLATDIFSLNREGVKLTVYAMDDITHPTKIVFSF